LAPAREALHRFAVAPFLGGAVLHDTQSGRLFRLNATASQAWQVLRDGGDQAAIARSLVEAHGVDAATARTDAGRFVAALRRECPLALTRPRRRGAADAPVPCHPPALGATYRVGGVPVRVTCFPRSVASSFAPLAAPARADAGPPAAVGLQLYRGGGRFVLKRDERLVERLASAPLARWALVRQMALANGRSWLALLHASAAASPGGCLVVCGGAGAGKSTLLAALLHAGLTYVADDILPLEAGSQLVWPVRFAISIKQGSWPTVGRLFPALACAPLVRFGGRTMRYLWPERVAVADDTVGCPPLALLFPRYTPGAPLSVFRIDPARALALLGKGGSLLPTTDAGLAEFLEWLERTPAFEMGFGVLDDAVRAACAVAASVPPRRHVRDARELAGRGSPRAAREGPA
jgi:hypothetical protein